MNLISNLPLEYVLDAVTDALIVMDPNGEIQLPNKAALRLLGFSHSDLLGQRVESLFSGRVPSVVRQPTLLNGNASMVKGLQLNTKKGTYIPASIELSAIRRTDGQLDGAVLLIRRGEADMQADLREKELLLQEIHHRVKNNFQTIAGLLGLQASYLTDADARELFRDSQVRVQSMALIHEKLYESFDLAQVNLAEYLRDLSNQLFRMFGREGIAFEMDAPVSKIGIEVAVPIGLMVTELMSNSFKHAFPAGRTGKIRLVLREDVNEWLTLCVGDDGVGFPAGVDFRQTDTLGLQLVTILATQLGGHIELDNTAGSVFKVSFPIAPFKSSTN